MVDCRGFACVIVGVMVLGTAGVSRATHNTPVESEMPTIDAGAEVVHLRKNCPSTLANCFERIPHLLEWTWGIYGVISSPRHPDAQSPLTVRIGPGTFSTEEEDDDIWFCDAGTSGTTPRGHVAFMGSGRGITVLTGMASESHSIYIRDCDELSFHDLTISGLGCSDGGTAAACLGGPSGFLEKLGGVYWDGAGSSSWSNVDIVGYEHAAWIDLCDTAEGAGLHYFHGTKVQKRTNRVEAAFATQCGESWFYGGEITATNSGTGFGARSMVAVRAADDGQIQIFGSFVRALTRASDSYAFTENPQTTGTPRKTHGGLLAEDGGIIHMHGGIISSVSQNSSLNVNTFGALAVEGGFIHTPGTAYTQIPTGSGKAYRAVQQSTGSALVPFLWQSGSAPPAPNGQALNSVTGQDVFVEADCASSGCGSSGNETHMLIYNANCGSDPWFDVGVGKCRDGSSP